MWAIQIAKIIHSHIFCTIIKHKLNPKAIFSVLIRHFLIALYISFFIL